MLEKWKGLIIRTTDVGDFDRMLTVLVAEIGKISVFCRGIKRCNNSMQAATQLFCYSEFMLYRGRGSSYRLQECTPIETFFTLREDIEKLALATYLVDVAGEICLESNNETDMLRLTLNALWCLEKSDIPHVQLKGTFELRTAAISGFLPRLSACGACGAENGDGGCVLDVMDGCLLCRPCYDRQRAEPVTDSGAHIFLPLSPGTLAAMHYVLSARAEKQFSFRLDASLYREFQNVCETYLLSHIGHGFHTLSFYKSLEAL